MPYAESIYWDSTVWFAWLLDEKRPNDEMQGVRDCLDRVEANEVLIFSGDVLLTLEVVALKQKPEHRRALAEFQRRRNVRIMTVNDPRIAELNADLKAHYRKLNSTDKKGDLGEIDSIHLATAIHYQADAFYTFDAGQKGGRSLLSLSGNLGGHKLRVCKPPLTPFKQLVMDVFLKTP